MKLHSSRVRTAEAVAISVLLVCIGARSQDSNDTDKDKGLGDRVQRALRGYDDLSPSERSDRYGEFMESLREFDVGKRHGVLR